MRREAPPERRAPWPRPAEIEALLSRDDPRGPGIVPRFLPVAGDPRRERFVRTNVRAQKQAGFSIVTIVVPLGDLSSGRLRAVAALARSYGDGTVRTTATQNLVLRWVPGGARRPAPRAPRAHRPRRAGPRVDRRRRELPGRRVVQARRHPVARARGAPRRALSRGPRVDRSRAGFVDPRERVPERLRASSRRWARVPRRASQGRRSPRAAIFPLRGRRRAAGRRERGRREAGVSRAGATCAAKAAPVARFGRLRRRSRRAASPCRAPPIVLYESERRDGEGHHVVPRARGVRRRGSPLADSRRWKRPPRSRKTSSIPERPTPSRLMQKKASAQRSGARGVRPSSPTTSSC